METKVEQYLNSNDRYEQQYEEDLNELGIPELEKESNGGRIPDQMPYGTWLKHNDPIAFNTGLNDYKK